MADIQADWSSNSNDAVQISLVAPGVGGPTTLHTFNPKFTYPIFGDEEAIFGYQGLKINLRYHICDMRPDLQISYSKKFKAVGDTEPTDIKAILEDYLPKTAFDKAALFDASVADPQTASWHPPGRLWKTIEAEGKIFEVWKGSLEDLAVQQMIKRIQIMVPFFIEGGTFIDMREPDSLFRWTVFFFYEKKSQVPEKGSPYCFVGYSTVYRYYFYQNILSNSLSKGQRINRPADKDFSLDFPTMPFENLPCRSRISQFVILPPFQGGGNGSRFYNTIFEFYLEDAHTIEITVEDPNEAFDDLRDINDLARLRKEPKYTALRIDTEVTPRAKGPVPNAIVDLKALEKLRKKMKIAPRQFLRITEMQLLSLIPTNIRASLLIEQPKASPAILKAKEHEYHLWQLWVKTRLYKHNKDMLMQLDRVERIEKLEQALGGVEADYARLLRALKSRSPNQANGSSGANLKRGDRDDGDDDGESSAKKAKYA